MHTGLENAVARLLRTLPEDAGRPYDWSEFQRRALAAPAAAARVARLRALAAAAVIALAVGAAAIRFGGGARSPAPPAVAGRAAATVTRQAAAPPAASADESRAEDWLESLPQEPGVVRVGTRAAVETLEDHIAEVDDLMSSERVSRAPAARLHALQQERARLVSSLVQVRYAETLADASR